MSRPIDVPDRNKALVAKPPSDNDFDYRSLEASIAQQAQAAAQRIHQLVKHTLETIIAIGSELQQVQANLPPGRFRSWLRAEFDWSERTARNMMAVAKWLQDRSEIISLRIEPTAAYRLAAPGTPPLARDEAIRRAEQGDPITLRVAKQIIATARTTALPQEQAASSGERAQGRWGGPVSGRSVRDASAL
jgi:hypothetical protein